MSYIGNRPFSGVVDSTTIKDGEVKTVDIADGAVTAAKLAAGAAVPDQTGHAGQFLTTDGTNADWASVDALPAQDGYAGKFLTTNGTNASWADTGASAGVFWENDQTLISNYTLTTNKNAMSAGPITIDTGVTVTIPTGSRWVVV